MMDFTLNMFEKLCKTIATSDYKVLTVKAYILSKNKPKKFIILRHDVDSKPEYALKMAKIERKYGLYSTYYFRSKPYVFNVKIIKEVKSLGHEIGYHYECLDTAKGDYEKAIKIFQKELEEFRKIFDIKTICSHGNPFTPWYNGDLWKKYDFKDFGLIGEAYQSIDFNSLVYFSDAGGRWNDPRIRNTKKLIKLIESEKEKHIYILTHAGIWTDNFGDWSINFARAIAPRSVEKVVRWIKKKMGRELW